jgi:hypothetical protein
MASTNPGIREFFADYEKVNADFDVERIASFYAEVFMFGGPQGVQAVKRDDFVKVLPRRKEFFKSAGLVSSKVAQAEISELDSKYSLVKVDWTMRIERAGREPVESKNSSSYVLLKSGDSFVIVFQLDHQDLGKKLQDLG